MYGYIYKTTDLTNGKIYIGQHKSPRFDKTYLGSGKRLKNEIQNHGKEHFRVEILEQIEDGSKMDEREIYWIAFFNSTDRHIGYNLSNGGNTSRALSGDKNGFFGRHHTKEQKEKWSKERKGRKLRPHTQEEKDKISQGNKGKIVSEKTRKKLSTLAKQRKHPPITEEQKRKISQSNKGKSRCKNYVHITDGANDKFVPKEKLEDYLHSGWHRGRKRFSPEACKNISLGHKGQEAYNKGMMWVTDGQTNKSIAPRELDEYLARGWKRGRKPKCARKRK